MLRWGLKETCVNTIGFMLFFEFEFVSFFLLAFKGGSGGSCIHWSYTYNILFPGKIAIVRILL